MNNSFNIDYKKLVVLLTPTFLRQPIWLSLMRVLIQPMAYLHDKFLSKRTDHLYNLAHNGQVCYLKDALNREFGIEDYQQGFQIEDINAEGEFVYAYDEAAYLTDTERLWLVPDKTEGYTMIYDESSITPSTSSFVVYVPFLWQAGSDVDYRIRAIVEQYRLVSRIPEYRLKPV